MHMLIKKLCQLCQITGSNSIKNLRKYNVSRIIYLILIVYMCSMFLNDD